MLMIFVDNVGGWFQGWIDHSPWDVVHLADFVMPLFLFMVGVSMGAHSQSIRVSSSYAQGSAYAIHISVG